VKKNIQRDTLKEHLIQPFDIPYPGRERTYLSSGFCNSDESTTIIRRTVLEGESDVNEVECSLCGGSVITYKHSSHVSSTYSPEIVGCLIQKDKTLLFVVETSLSQSDFVMVRDVILAHLAKHDFTASFQKINVFRSGVNSSLVKKLPHKRDLLSTQKLKSISEEIKSNQLKQGLQEKEQNHIQEKERKLRKELAASAGKLLRELRKLSTLPEQKQKKISSSQPVNLPKTSKNLREKLSKVDAISFRKQIKDLVEQDSIYD